MKKLIFFCLAFISVSSMQAQQVETSNRIAVMEFTANVGLNQTDVEGLSGIFITYFHPTGYIVIERGKLNKVLKEQNLQMSTITEKDAAKIGEILNLSKIVVGDVNVIMGEYNVDVRVLNVTTGAIVATSGMSFTSSSYRKSMQQLANDLADKIAIKYNNPTSLQSTPPTTTATPTYYSASESLQSTPPTTTVTPTTTPTYYSASELMKYYYNGIEAMQNKDFASAATDLDTFINGANGSSDPAVQSNLATAKKYIAMTYLNLGLHVAGQNDLNSSIKYLDIAVERADRYGEAQTGAKAKAALAKVCQAQGGKAFNNKDYATAATILAKGYEAYPRNTDLALMLAMCYCESGRYEQGMEVYRNVAAMTPADRYADAIAKAKAALAKVCQAQGGKAFNNKDYATAATILAKGYKANPRNTDLALMLAMSYCESGEYEKGMEVYRNVAAMTPADRYADAIAKANEMMILYTDNERAKNMQ